MTRQQFQQVQVLVNVVRKAAYYEERGWDKKAERAGVLIEEILSNLEQSIDERTGKEIRASEVTAR